MLKNGKILALIEKEHYIFSGSENGQNDDKNKYERYESIEHNLIMID